MSEQVCAACGETVTDSVVDPDVEVVAEAEAAAIGLEEIIWVCDDCFRKFKVLGGSDSD